jgi:hypothetical protein
MLLNERVNPLETKKIWGDMREVCLAPALDAESNQRNQSEDQQHWDDNKQQAGFETSHGFPSYMRWYCASQIAP